MQLSRTRRAHDNVAERSTAGSFPLRKAVGLARSKEWRDSMNVRPTTFSRLCIVGDESSHTGHHYLAYGTVSFNQARKVAIEKRLQATIPPPPLDFERSWNHKGYLGLYLKFVDAVFRCRNDYGLSFRCTVVDAHQANSPSFGSTIRTYPWSGTSITTFEGSR